MTQSISELLKFSFLAFVLLLLPAAAGCGGAKPEPAVSTATSGGDTDPAVTMDSKTEKAK